MEAHKEPTDGVADNEQPRNSSCSSVSLIAVALNFWKDFVESERTKLDEQALKIAENQETSLKNRRKLAESTRDFKKASNEEKLKLFNSLLKAYQEEVDNLTKRAKFEENAFLNFYQRLFEAPDPCPALVSARELASKVTKVEFENRKMKYELEDYRDEAAYLKNKQAIINRQLEQQAINIEKMGKELQLRPSTKQVEDLRKQVKILQAVGCNSIEAEDWEVATTGEDMTKLETLLLDKKQKMEHELTQLKVKLSEKTTATEASEARVKELAIKVAEQQRLISQLEEDILKGYSSVDRGMTKPDDWDLPELGISGVLEKTEHKKSQVAKEQNSMLQVICSQRDRFWQRLREAEEGLRQAQEKIKVLEAELEKSKADNVKLYERTIQDYMKEWPISRGLKKRTDDMESGFSSDVELKYKMIYEDDINPFAASSKKELVVKEQRDSHELQNNTRVTENNATNVFDVQFRSNAKSTSFTSVPTFSCGSGSTSAFSSASTFGSGSCPTSTSFVTSSPSFDFGSIPAFVRTSSSPISSIAPAFGASSVLFGSSSTSPLGGTSSLFQYRSASTSPSATGLEFPGGTFSLGNRGEKSCQKTVKAKRDKGRRL